MEIFEKQGEEIRAKNDQIDARPRPAQGKGEADAGK